MKEVGGIATSLPGFIRMHEQMSKVIEALIKQGVLNKTQGAEPKSEAKLKTGTPKGQLNDFN